MLYVGCGVFGGWTTVILNPYHGDVEDHSRNDSSNVYTFTYYLSFDREVDVIVYLKIEQYNEIFNN